MNTQTLTPQEAVKVLINAVQVGQQKGAYSFEDSTLIFQAINTLTKPAPAPAPVVESADAE